MNRLVALVVALLSFALVGSGAILAQEATPEAGADPFPLTPDPAGCLVEPRSPDELIEIWFGEEGSPEATEAATESVTIPVGPPADEETVAGVIAIVDEVFSCFAAGDFARATALFTEDLTRTFGPEPGTPEEEVRAFLEATPEAGAAGEAGVIVAISDVMLLEDGRVGAFVVDRTEGRLSTVYAIFEQQGDRWLADEVIEFAGEGEDEEGAGTPTS